MPASDEATCADKNWRDFTGKTIDIRAALIVFFTQAQ
jgi:hypothetical protein